MSYTKAVMMLIVNCPFCKHGMELMEDLTFECPVCECKIAVTKKTIDYNRL